MNEIDAAYEELFEDYVDNMVKEFREQEIPTFVSNDKCTINIPKFNGMEATVLRWHHDHVYTVKLNETGQEIVAVANRGEMSYTTD